LFPTGLLLHTRVHLVSNRGRAYWDRTEANRVAFELAAIEFGALKDKPSKLANAGLLLATLFQGEAEVVQISMLTQIDKAADGALTRVIYDPLQ
jgi:hypothetical protein